MTALTCALAGIVTPASAQENFPLPLHEYPKPSADNGRGVHWSPGLFAQSTQVVDTYLAEIDAMNLRWITLMQPDQSTVEHAYLLSQLRQRGIEPILRVDKTYNDAYANLSPLVQAGRAAGVDYFELYGNPNVAGLEGGWRVGQAIDVDLLAQRWIDAARTVQAAGGYPGLPSLSPAGAVEDTLFLRQLLSSIVAQGGRDALNRAWLPVQNYMSNRPLDDPEGFSRFTRYNQIVTETLGRSLPILASEGGAVLGDQQNPAYPALTEGLIAQQTVAAFQFMSDSAPEYLFAFTPWLLVNANAGGYNGAWEAHAWFPTGRDPQPVVAAVKAMAGTGPNVPPMDMQYAESEPTPEQFQSAAQSPVRGLEAAEQTAPEMAQPAPEQSVLPPVDQSSEQSSEQSTTDAVSENTSSQSHSAQANPAPSVNETGKISLSEGTVTLPTYDYESALIPTERGDPIYPAPRLDHDRVGAPVDQTYDSLVLENDWLRLTILPELGGRIYRWEDKVTGRDILYHNPVVKPTRWGSRGWWLATGGMEWVYPLPDHGANEYKPWTAKQILDDDNAASVELSRTDSDGLKVTIQISLNGNARFFAVTAGLENRGSDPLQTHFWINTMLAPSPENRVDPNSQLVWPGEQFTVHGSAGTRALPMGATIDWPAGSGVDVSQLSNWPTHLSFFVDPGPRQGAVGLVDPTGDLAVVRSFPHILVPGVKAFYAPNLDPALWTDDGSGPYFELWGGPSKGFDTAMRLKPGQTVRWTEQWYTVPGLGSFVAASAHAALSLLPNEEGGTTLRLASTGSDAMRATGKRLTVRVGDEMVYSESADFGLNEILDVILSQRMNEGRWLVQLVDAQNRVLFVYDSGADVAVAPEPEDLPEDPIEWDERLDDLNVDVSRANVRSGQSYWKVIKAEFQNLQEGGGRHHIYIEALDEDGERIVDQRVEVRWPNGEATVLTEDKPEPEYAANFPMYGDLGGYRVKLPGLSDEVTGMGLPGGRAHVVYNLVFQRVVKE